jgi:hypothetical protein
LFIEVQGIKRYNIKNQTKTGMGQAKGIGAYVLL